MEETGLPVHGTVHAASAAKPIIHVQGRGTALQRRGGVAGVILWTVQDVAVWRQLEDSGTYTASSSRLEFPAEEDTALYHGHYACRWMAEQMRKRIGPPPEGVEFPVWAWYKQQGRPDGKPDMRQSHYYTGKPCVRMKLDVPDWEVLLSDFNDWHHPLNYWHLSASEEDSDAFDAWCE